MTAELGTWSLALAVLSAAIAVLAAIASMRFGQPSLLRTARQLTVVCFALLSVAMLALARALMTSDFSLAYVADYTERTLPAGYKFAALWAGQEGSILLWAWLLGLMAVIFVAKQRQREGVEPAAALATVAAVLAFFAALLVFAANPFVLLSVVPADGHGLNPLLQHPSMVAHPPLLFVGYAGFTIPMAILIGALVGGRVDNAWIGETRRWLLVAWAFLSVGILLGAQWAYVELGWGGYWAWDPVENASLLPWLTATALLHSLGAHRRFGMFKRFNAWLIAATFILCIFATYITRSGVIQSVHAFGQSLVGTFFLAFLVISIVGSVLAIVIQRKLLAAEQPLDSLTSRHGMFLIANTLLVVITLVTAVGTIFPLISGLFVAEPISVGPAFYNKVILPMALALTALMALGPLLRVGSDAARLLKSWLVIPIVAAIVCVAAFLAMGLGNLWTLTCVAIVTTGVTAIISNLWRLVRQRMTSESQGLMTALAQLIDSDHRRFGGQIVHVGVFMIVVGVAGSSLYNLNQTMQLSVGESATIGQYTLTYDRIEEVRGGNYTAIAATIKLADAGGQTLTLVPEQRFYDKSEQAHAQVALHMTLLRDVYVTLAGWDDNGQHAAFQAIINPLVSWIWIGGLVLTLGALFCIFPPLLPAPAPKHRVIQLVKPNCSQTMFASSETQS